MDKVNFFSMTGNEFALLSASLGVLLTKNLTADEQNSLGNFFLSVGQSLLTSAAQDQLKSSEK